MRSRERSSERHLLVDTLGLILNAVVHPADVQDRDGAVLVLDAHTRRLFPFLENVFAESAYGGPKLRRAMAGSGWEIEVVKRPTDQKKRLRGLAQALSRRAIPKGWREAKRLDQPPPTPG